PHSVGALGYSENWSDGIFPRLLDKIPKPVVVALLKASHPDDHRPFAHGARLLEAVRGVRRLEIVRRDDNSRRKIQNVSGDSSAVTWSTYRISRSYARCRGR